MPFKIGTSIVILVSSLVISSGCARTVTPIVDYGTTMLVDVNLRGNADTSANRYFMVLAGSATLKISLPPPYSDLNTPEFLEPEMTPFTGSLEAYYTNYYSTWSGLVEVDPSGYELLPGPFVQGQTPTRETIGNLTSATNTLHFSVNLAKVFGGTIPDNIYFEVVTVPWPNGQAKIPVDHLNSTNAYIAKISGTTQTVYDLTDEITPLPELDILSCRVEIQ